MRIVKPSATIINPNPFDREAADNILKKIEEAGRTCYKSEDKITERSAHAFVGALVEMGHYSVIEHGNITARIVCDRGVSHELVRHRLAAYSQESTRYCNYSKEKFGKEIAVIKPPGLTEDQRDAWEDAMLAAAMHYFEMLEAGASPQIARSVLPNSLKTEIVMTANLREWRHILNIRVVNDRAHPQIRQALLPILRQLKTFMPEVFNGLWVPIDLCASLGHEVEEFKPHGVDEVVVRCRYCGLVHEGDMDWRD